MPAIKDRPGNARPVQDLLRRRVKALHQLDDNDIYGTARASMALPVDEGFIAIAMFRMGISQARSLVRLRNGVERLTHAALAENRDYQLWRMIPGIGPILCPDDLGKGW